MSDKGNEAELKARGRKLLACINNKNLEDIENLLQDGVDFTVTHRGDAAIHLAARNGQTDIIAQLLRYGDDVCRRNENGNLAIHYAARNGHMSTVDFLIENGSKVNVENETGDTPLHFAVMYQSMDFIEQLAELGMRINVQNQKGETPLRVAVGHNRTEAMEALLIYRADPDIKDKNGNKPADVARTPAVAEQLRICGDLMAAMASGYIQAEGIAVKPEQRALKLDRVGVSVENVKSSEVLPYQFYCRREKSENSEIKIPIEKSEEYLSDVYHFRSSDAVDVVRFEAKVPLYTDVGVREQAEVKYVDGQTENVENTFDIDGQTYCTVRLEVRPGSTAVFIIISKPKVEERVVGTSGTTVKSDVEEKFQLKVPPGSFTEETKVSLKVYDRVEECEKPASKRLKSQGVRKLLTDIYEIQINGKQPSKKVKITFPLSLVTSEDSMIDDSEIVIVAADENNLVDETSLEILPSRPKKMGDTLSFYVSHFSIHVAVPLRMITGSPRSVFDQIVSSRDLEKPAIFFVMILEKGRNQTCAVVECVLAEKGSERMRHWEEKGYVKQEIVGSNSFLFKPGQDFKITFLGNVVATGAKGLRKLTFVPKRPSYQPYRLTLHDRDKPPEGEVEIISVKEVKEATVEKSENAVDVTKLPFKVPVPPPIEIHKRSEIEEVEEVVPVLTENERRRLRKERRESREKKELWYKDKRHQDEGVLKRSEDLKGKKRVEVNDTRKDRADKADRPDGRDKDIQRQEENSPKQSKLK